MNLMSNGVIVVNKFNQNYGQKTIKQSVESVGNKKYKITVKKKKKRKKMIVGTIKTSVNFVALKIKNGNGYQIS